MVLVSIIIVNWNAGHQLRDCLASIKTLAGREPSYEVLVVDNGSSDDSLTGLESDSLVDHVIRNGKNCGFSVGCNQGARLAKGDYLLFLNPDTRLFRDSLSVPVTFMENSSNSQVAICGIQLINEQGAIARSCARIPNSLGMILHAIGVDRIIPHLGHSMQEWDHAETKRVDHVIGAFYLIRRRVFETLGGFDERFFVYLEDLDLSLRAMQQGGVIMYLSEAQAFHAGGGTSRQIKAGRLFFSLQSRLLFGFKHFSFLGSWGAVLATLLVEPFVRLLHVLARGRFPDVRHTLQGYWMLFKNLPDIIQTTRTDRRKALR